MIISIDDKYEWDSGDVKLNRTAILPALWVRQLKTPELSNFTLTLAQI